MGARIGFWKLGRKGRDDVRKGEGTIFFYGTGGEAGMRASEKGRISHFIDRGGAKGKRRGKEGKV